MTQTATRRAAAESASRAVPPSGQTPIGDGRSTGRRRVGAGWAAAIAVVAALGGCAGLPGQAATEPSVRVAQNGPMTAMPVLGTARTRPGLQSCSQTASFVDDCSGFPRYVGP